MTKREKLQRALLAVIYQSADQAGFEMPGERYGKSDMAHADRYLSALMNELNNVSPGMARALIEGLDTDFGNPTGEDVVTQSPVAGWTAVLNYIRDGGE